jgi:hypothetical protein
VRVVLLHALNPYGFAWNRRVNEDNADINRNFVDHAAPPANPAYDALAEAIAPQSLSPEALKTADARLRAFAAAKGDFALQSAISAGQYSHPDGLYYGGARESWSAAMLAAVLREHLCAAKRLIVIDYHTGLGESGDAQMITEDLPHSTAYKRQKAIWGARVRSADGGESLSAPLTGTMDKALAQMMAETELTFAALEVGTVPLHGVFEALRKDNWLHCHSGRKTLHNDPIKREIRAAFYPETAAWKAQAWAHARETFEQALKAIA